MSANALDHIAMLTETLRGIAAGRDCDYVYDADRPDPCNCPPCAAKAALELAGEWRYRGARHQRATNGFNPREAAIVAAWSKSVDDRRLAQILDPGAPDDKQRVFVFHETLQPPTARDWFVATSVVQWLVTNVGSAVLQEAGWEYTRYGEDRKALDAKQRETAPLFAPGSTPEHGSILSFNKRTWHGVIALHGENAGEIEFHGTCVEGGCGVLLEDADVVGRPVFVTRNRDGGLVRVSVPPRTTSPDMRVALPEDPSICHRAQPDGRTTVCGRPISAAILGPMDGRRTCPYGCYRAPQIGDRLRGATTDEHTRKVCDNLLPCPLHPTRT